MDSRVYALAVNLSERSHARVRVARERVLYDRMIYERTSTCHTITNHDVLYVRVRTSLAFAVWHGKYSYSYSL